MPPDLAYIGLGANLGDRLATLRAVTAAIAAGQLHGVALSRVSPVFETSPLGPARYPFLNAALELTTDRRPEELLDLLLGLEQRHGRVRGDRWAPRTLDLDLLLILRGGAHLTHGTAKLTLPHPEIARRDFVLAPLAALAPELLLHPHATVGELLAQIPAAQRTILKKIPDQLC
ncbi:MAG: 2-amino-4-hydroxy-6-hydroxymethyldihydropteridine diphosphokinase [Nannocystis sp.]|jgi:2-amino-4-hydroxy-6-hydroxymethyldihydropteridine diphosphokinase|nr:2-amino-4-hydroxy-6-hydroxymethyldihydropteridine diphosphokinase [Nannocystis sp.]